MRVVPLLFATAFSVECVGAVASAGVDAFSPPVETQTDELDGHLRGTLEDNAAPTTTVGVADKWIFPNIVAGKLEFLDVGVPGGLKFAQDGSEGHDGFQVSLGW